MSRESIRGLFESPSLEVPNQEITSTDTSINSSRLPAIYRLVTFTPGDVVLDYGGGKFDNGLDYLESLGCIAAVYDPFNRSSEYNAESLSLIDDNGGADIVLLSNVLNVVKEENARASILTNCKKLLKPSGKLYITVYEGKSTGEGSPTTAGYQLNRKTAQYLSEVSNVFTKVTRKGKLIIAQ
jgi:hypothetical protein